MIILYYKGGGGPPLPEFVKKNKKIYSIYLHITSGAIYPGVPEVSWELSALKIRAIPKSVTLKYPFLSKTKFSGFMSRWIILFLCKLYNPSNKQAAKNFV